MIPAFAALLAVILPFSALAGRKCAVPGSGQVESIALQDASGRSTYDLGNYDRCANITFGYLQPFMPSAQMYAQYCLINSGGVVFGACLPKSCSLPNDTLNLTNGLFLFLLGSFDFFILLDPSDATYTCGDHAQPWSLRAMAVALYLAVSACLVAVGTPWVHRKALQKAKLALPAAADGIIFPEGVPILSRSLSTDLDTDRSASSAQDGWTQGEGEGVVTGTGAGLTMSITAPIRAWLSRMSGSNTHVDGSYPETVSSGGNRQCGGEALPASRRTDVGSPFLASASRTPGARPLLYSFDEDEWDGEQDLLRGYTYGGGRQPQGQLASERGAVHTARLPRSQSSTGYTGMVAHWSGAILHACDAMVSAFTAWKQDAGSAAATASILPPHERWLSSRLPLLDGLRVLSAAWAVIGYSTLFFIVPGISNMAAISPPQGVATTAAFQLLASAPLSADTFLLLTGFLSLRSMLALDAKGRSGQSTRGQHGFNVQGIAYVAFKRVAHIVPTAYFSVSLVAWLLPALGSGPFWPSFLSYIAPCTGMVVDVPVKAGLPYTPTDADGTVNSGPSANGALWWTVPALANNLWPAQGGPHAVCMPWTAYIGAGTQLAIILAPLLAYVFLRAPAAGISVALTCITAALVSSQEIVTQVGASGLHDYGTLGLSAQTGSGQITSSTYSAYWDVYAAKPWARAPSFLLGALLAFVCERVSTARHRAEGVRTNAQSRTSMLGIETYLSLHAGVAQDGTKGGMYRIPATLPILWCWALQGAALSIMGTVLVAPFSAFGTQQGAAPWSQGEVTGYTVLCGPAWAFGLSILLFIAFTQGPAAIIGPTGGPGSLWDSMEGQKVGGQETAKEVKESGRPNAGSYMRSPSVLSTFHDPMDPSAAPTGAFRSPAPLPSTKILPSTFGNLQTPVSVHKAGPDQASSTGQARSSLLRVAHSAPSVIAPMQSSPPRGSVSDQSGVHGSGLFAGPEIVLTPWLTSRWWTMLAPVSLPAIYLGPSMVLAINASSVEWNRYSALTIVQTAAGSVLLAFLAGAVTHLLVGQPAHRLIKSIRLAVWRALRSDDDDILIRAPPVRSSSNGSSSSHAPGPVPGAPRGSSSTTGHGSSQGMVQGQMASPRGASSITWSPALQYTEPSGRPGPSISRSQGSWQGGAGAPASGGHTSGSHGTGEAGTGMGLQMGAMAWSSRANSIASVRTALSSRSGIASEGMSGYHRSSVGQTSSGQADAGGLGMPLGTAGSTDPTS